MITLLLIGAMNYQNNLAYLLGFGLISLFLVTKIETYRQLLGLEVAIGHIEPVFCGQAVKLPVIIKSKAQQRFSIEIDKDEVHRCDDVTSPQGNVVLSLPTDKRGLHRLGLVRITSRFPLGLFYAWTPMPMALNYLVYPEPEPHAPTYIQPDHADPQSGGSKLGDDDFAGIKAYHPGDAPKHIHWKSYAKGQGLQSKQFASAQQQQLWFDWQATEGLAFERRLSRLTRWLLDAEQQGQRFGLRMPHQNIEAGSGSAHLHRCLKVLALYQQETPHD
jgi:uncharacterized protein (DUF58 family)